MILTVIGGERKLRMITLNYNVHEGVLHSKEKDKHIHQTQEKMICTVAVSTEEKNINTLYQENKMTNCTYTFQ